MYYKVHEGMQGITLAVCDEYICGKKLKLLDGGIFYVNPEFYKDKRANKSEIIKLFKIAVSINLVGKESVQLGIESGIINKKNIIEIQRVPHAQMIIVEL